MTIGGSLFLIAAGAILKWAVTAQLSWIDIQTAGTVLFVVGLVSLVLSIVYTFWWAHRSRPAARDTTRPMAPPRGPRDRGY